MRTTVYLHSAKEDMLEHGEKIGLSESALQNFRYALYEVGIDLEVDENGMAKIVGIDGREVVQ